MSLQNDFLIWALTGSFFLALLISMLSIPVIIRVADIKQLMDTPDLVRKLHGKPIPTLGGVAIFSGLLFSYSVFTDFYNLSSIPFMTASLLLLFFAGMKDDILVLSPGKKLFIQAICAFLITTLGQVKLTSLWGMFGVTLIPQWLGVIIAFLVIVSFINAFNLIDGVNGLAGILGLIAALFFAAWFALFKMYALSFLAISLAGALLGFLFYNFNRAKIFMGDTGSMLVGFALAVLALKFIEANRTSYISSKWFYIKAAPAVALATLLIPALDMVRVFFYRISKKHSPFRADRSHIHHMLLDIFKQSHLMVTLFLGVLAVGFIALSLYLKKMRSLDLIMILSVVWYLVTIVIIIYRKKMMGVGTNQTTNKTMRVGISQTTNKMMRVGINQKTNKMTNKKTITTNKKTIK